MAAALLAGAAAAAFAGVRLAGSHEGSTSSSAAPIQPLTTNRFDETGAFQFLRWQVRLGPRPAGSQASKKLAARLRAELPNGRYQRVPGGLRNVLGTVRGRQPGRVVVVGAHYDTKDLPEFVGANDGASGTAVLLQLARSFRPGDVRPTLMFAFFDGEESPRGTPDAQFERRGLRGSKVASRVLRHAEAMFLLDFVGDRDLALPRERGSDEQLYAQLRGAARRVGTARYFAGTADFVVVDDHTPFQRVGVPAVDLIDFSFPCFHRPCDDLTAVSERSLDIVGETMVELLRNL